MKKTLILCLFILTFSFWVSAQDGYHKLEVSGGYTFTRADGYPGNAILSTDTSGTSGTLSNPDSLKRRNMNGFAASGVYNFSKYLGAKVDFSGSYGKDDNTFLPGGVFQRTTTPNTILVIPGTGGIKSRLTQYNYMGGIQLKNNSKDKTLKPFAQILVGLARQKTDYTNIDSQRANIIGTTAIKSNGFTYALGGGLDIRVSKRIDIRVVQFDYNPVYIKAQTTRNANDILDAKVSGFEQVRSFMSYGIAKRRQDNFCLGFGIVFH